MKATLLVSALLCIPVLAQAPPKPAEAVTFAKVLDEAVVYLETQLVPASEAMPEEKYGFVPASGEFKNSRSFGLLVKHIAVNNYWMGSTILGEKMPVEDDATNNGPTTIKTKADIVKFLKDSFVYAHKAIATINEQNILATLKSPWGDSITRLRLATIVDSHGFDHYGQIAIYLRLSGIVPPGSRKQ